jgi:hypothetical protein
MTDDLIKEAASLMEEQAREYARLEAACNELSESLIQGAPSAVESMTQNGEVVLVRMRSRLVRIIRVLTDFAEARNSALDNFQPLSPAARTEFETASNNLMSAAQQFQQTRVRAAALTTGGSTFATACIEMCGIQPTTYRGPYARSGETKPWA